MSKTEVVIGYSKNGLPYLKTGSGKQNLVVFDGLSFIHKPPSGFQLRMQAGWYRPFIEDFTVYQVGRKPGLPEGCSIRDMAADYAEMIKNEMVAPLDVMGLSTGGSIAQWFALDYPEMVNRLVLASTGYRLSDGGKRLQMKTHDCVISGDYRNASAAMAEAMYSGPVQSLMKALFWLTGGMMFGGGDKSDGLVEILAEDRHDFSEHLAEIKAPTLVIGGANDGFYLIPETAEGIPNARLVIYENAGHTVAMKSKFMREVFNFLMEDGS